MKSTIICFDPAHNILSDNNSPTVPDNRLKTYNGTTYYYDELGNLIHHELADGEVQNYFYDLQATSLMFKSTIWMRLTTSIIIKAMLLFLVLKNF